MRLSEAYDAPYEWVPLDLAHGRTAGDFVIVYPPDAPVIVPGEIFTDEIIEEIKRKQAENLTFLGLRGDRVKVLQ